MSQASVSPLPDSQLDAFMNWASGRSKSALTLAAAICYTIFWQLGRIIIPASQRHLNPSLLLEPSVVMAVILTIVGLFICTIVISLLQARGQAQDPLFAVAAGLAALSWRGGTMTDLVQTMSLSGLLVSIVELLLLGAMLAGCAMLLRRMRGAAEKSTAEWNKRLSALGVTVVVMAFLIYVLAQSDAKKQMLASVGIAAFAGAAVAYSFFNVEDWRCYVAAPFVVGIAGYLLAYAMPGQWQTGRLGQPLAFACPLDYASLGTAGAMVGYWTAQAWRHESDS